MASLNLKPQLDSGEFRAIATTTAKRTTWLPNVPTAIETGMKDFEVTSLKSDIAKWAKVINTAGIKTK